MQWSRIKGIVLFEVHIVVKKNKSTVVLAWSGLLLTTVIFVITVFKICGRLTRYNRVRPRHFDRCNDEYRC